MKKMKPAGSRSSARMKWLKIAAGVVLLVVLILAGRLIDIQSYLDIAQKWVWSLGPWGPIAYGVLYVVATLLFIPGSPFSIIAALLFGTLWGYVIMLCSTTIAAIISFLLARSLLKDRVQRHLGEQKLFETLSGWVEKNPWLAIPVVPFFPFSLNNYALGLTHVTFRQYLLGSLAIFIPMTGIFIFGANALYRAAVRGEVSWGLLGGSVAVGLLILVLGYYGKKFFLTDEQDDDTVTSSP